MHAEKKSFSLKKRGESFRFATRGIITFLANEHNAWIHIVVLALVVMAGFFFSITAIEWSVIVLISAMVLMAEAFNTAIEHLCNYVEPSHQPMIGKIKDIAAGAVLITAMAAVIIGMIIFTPYIVSTFL